MISIADLFSLSKVSQDLSEQIASFTPCEGRDSGYTKYGSCQAGTSIALDGDDLLIGKNKEAKLTTFSGHNPFAKRRRNEVRHNDPFQATLSAPKLCKNARTSIG